jgi:hypothetical protein
MKRPFLFLAGALLATACTTAAPVTDAGTDAYGAFPDGGFVYGDTGLCSGDAGEPHPTCDCDGTMPFVCGPPPERLTYVCIGGYWETGLAGCSWEAGVFDTGL